MTMLVLLFIFFFLAFIIILLYLLNKILDWEAAEQRRMTWKEFFKGDWV